MSAHIWTFVESVAFILARKAGSVGRMGNIFPSIRNIPKLVPELLELMIILLTTITLIIIWCSNTCQSAAGKEYM